ncbi:hypothetical protein RIF29_14291 [Crotalaria pallida]|uniref:Uncharacterized protein n=1 Tax=Crotalaria pallida TaxID=3830 RepID=A0AAN9FB70_CROPI
MARKRGKITSSSSPSTPSSTPTSNRNPSSHDRNLLDEPVTNKDVENVTNKSHDGIMDQNTTSIDLLGDQETELNSLFESIESLDASQAKVILERLDRLRHRIKEKEYVHGAVHGGPNPNLAMNQNLVVNSSLGVKQIMNPDPMIVNPTAKEKISRRASVRDTFDISKLRNSDLP